MEFSMKDIALISTMSLAVVLMSLLFPMAGLTDDGDSVNSSEIPEFNLSASQFDIVGDFPESPGTPTSGQLVYDQSLPSPTGIAGRSLLWIDRPKDDGVAIELQNGTVNDDFEVVVTHFNASDNSAFADRLNITGQEGQTLLYENNSWTIEFTVSELDNFNQPNMTATVEYEVLAAEEGASGGGVFSFVGELVGMLAYLGDIIFWFVGFLFELALTLVLILVEIATFAVSLMQWLIGTYSSIVSSAGGFASVILTIPLLILLLEFVKIGMVLLSLLPTT